MSKPGKNNLSLGDALLQQGKTPQLPASPVVLPVAEIPMVLTLDELRPNPDNPRISRNPRFDDIKASIRARGLDSVPKVTRDPNSGNENIYIFSDGGNTRYQILSELWQETEEERFYRIPCLLKPWPGRLHCIIGHLAENEVRGDLMFIEKAFGVRNARAIHEEHLGRRVTQRELMGLLKQGGLPISQTSISQMDNTVQYLYPCIPTLLISGMGRPQATNILALRTDAQKIWNTFSAELSCEKNFDAVFSEACQRLDDPEAYSFEILRDELIGELLKALPHPALNYDRWLLELDPKERNRRQLFGDPPPVADHLRQADMQAALVSEGLVPSVTKSSGQVSVLETQSPVAVIDNQEDEEAALPSKIETQPGVHGAQPTLSTLSTVSDLDKEDIEPLMSVSALQISPSALNESHHRLPEALSTALSCPSDVLSFARTGLEPVNDIWSISPVQDDIEHLQAMAFRLAFELAEEMGGADELEEAKDTAYDAGYRLTHSHTASEFVQVLLSLAGNNGSNGAPVHTDMLGVWLVGTGRPEEIPVLPDVAIVKFMRLIRVLRRLHELQRDLPVGSEEREQHV
ncbi:ParB family protein [Photorhabdus tasmaniensis]|uniref:ParB family protein n=1 Tax=Photorhabdus tasmaniensis TaxID=1004159 RepID=UPI0040432CE7